MVILQLVSLEPGGLRALVLLHYVFHQKQAWLFESVNRSTSASPARDFVQASMHLAFNVRVLKDAEATVLQVDWVRVVPCASPSFWTLRVPKSIMSVLLVVL